MANFMCFSAEYNHYILQTDKKTQIENGENECFILLFAKS